jgi:signal transduction histidine kinase
MTDMVQLWVTLAVSKTRRGSVAVTIEIEDGLPMIEADHHQLSQVFTNLLTNAFEALDGRGKIAVTAFASAIEEDPAFAGLQPPTPTIVVDVADDGPGLPREAIDKIFDPFYTTKPQGSGLGLAIVRKIVDAHDGRIDVSSVPGAGTRFRVTLPVKSSSEWFKK